MVRFTGGQKRPMGTARGRGRSGLALPVAVAGASLFGLTLAGIALADSAPGYELSFGSFGTSLGQFHSPKGIETGRASCRERV